MSLIYKFIARKAFLEQNGLDTSDLEKEWSTLQDLNINTYDDFKDFHIVSTYVPQVLRKININSPEDIAKISANVFNNRKSSNIRELDKLYVSIIKALKEEDIPIKKIAYPQGTVFDLARTPYDLNKWVQTMREIYALASRGTTEKQAFEQITSKWDTMEKRDFDNWMKYYKSNEHLKYKSASLDKTAQYTIGNGIPISQRTDVLKASLPAPVRPYSEEKNEAAAQAEELARQNQLKLNKQQIVADLVRKMIGRFNSIEKLFTSPDFQSILGPEREKWLATVHELKRKLQTADIKTAGQIDLFKAIIVREGHKLAKQGFNKSANLMYVLAQDAPAAPKPEEATTETPEETTPEAPAPDLSNIPMPDMSEMPDMEDENDEDAAMEEFVAAMSGKTEEKDEENAANDLVVAEDELDENFKIIAQVAPPVPEDPAQPASNQEVQPAAPAAPAVPQADASAIDANLSAALKNTTTADIINHLEQVADMFRNRQQARELNIIDLKMQALGIASFAPELAEAINKALESNQYILTRVEDVLSRLRGANAMENGSVSELKNKLQQGENNEAAKRDQKARMEMAPQQTAQPPVAAPPAPQAAPPTEAPAASPEMQQPAAVEQPAQPGVRV